MDAREIAHDLPHGGGFVEVGDRCWVARYEHLDVNVGLVGGDRGLLLIDTLASEAAARVAVEHVRRLGAGEVVAVVNTHAHFDHFLGNAVLAEECGGLDLVAHEEAAAAMPEEHRAATAAGDAGGRLVVPGTTFSSAKVVDLGDRAVEVLHPGRGHTAGDAVVRVPDADVLFAGDLVEESALRGAVPGFGADCYPLEWPATLDLVVSLLGPGSVVVPGHGLPVDRDFAVGQRDAIGVVAETVRELAGRGVRPEDMAAAAEWPYPAEELGHAFTRGFAMLPRDARSLPLA